ERAARLGVERRVLQEALLLLLPGRLRRALDVADVHERARAEALGAVGLLLLLALLVGGALGARVDEGARGPEVRALGALLGGLLRLLVLGGGDVHGRLGGAEVGALLLLLLLLGRADVHERLGAPEVGALLLLLFLLFLLGGARVHERPGGAEVGALLL